MSSKSGSRSPKSWKTPSHHSSMSSLHSKDSGSSSVPSSSRQVPKDETTQIRKKERSRSRSKNLEKSSKQDKKSEFRTRSNTSKSRSVKSSKVEDISKYTKSVSYQEKDKLQRLLSPGLTLISPGNYFLIGLYINKNI